MRSSSSSDALRCGDESLEQKNEGAVKNDDQKLNDTASATTDYHTFPKTSRLRKKDHSLTICMVPPLTDETTWDAITKARIELRDPGLYRWPPHANLLYPFLVWWDKNTSDTDSSSEVSTDEDCEDDNDDDDEPDMIESLRRAASSCEPFHVTLDTLGTFGGKNRGVLWLYPRSFRHSNMEPTEKDECHKNSEDFERIITEDEEEPLILLQSALQKQFTLCNDQNKQGKFTPHMTLSHFETLQDALDAKQKIESWWTPLSFPIREIFLLRRIGDDGQFRIVSTIPLGHHHHDADAAADIEIHDPPKIFPLMPNVEYDWVREERMKLKSRRNANMRRWGHSGGGRRRRRKSRKGRQQEDEANSGRDHRGPSRSTDTPEEIMAKRAARKAKRERLANVDVDASQLE